MNLYRSTISLSDYSLDRKPDYKKLGRIVDDALRPAFFGKDIAVRYLSLRDHLNLKLDELAKIIEETGADRYDPERKMSVAHDFYFEKGVELFAVPVRSVGADLNITAEAIKDFYEGAMEDRGYSLRIDLIVIYDLNKLDMIPIQYGDGVGEDAFKFKYPERKPEAVMGIIKLL